MTFLPDGAAAPPFEMTTVATKRPVRVNGARSAPLLLTFVSANTAATARDVVIAVRRHVPAHSALQVANVVDLRSVPRLLRGTAQRIMESVYQRAVAEIPDEYDARDHLLLLPDWDGKLFAAYRVPDVGRWPALVAVDAAGRLHGSYHGEKPDEAAVALAQSLTAESGRTA